jgi:hypothetical protein
MIDDLEDPFITLGLAKTRQEVRDIVSLYDDNGNGKIEFDEFLDILDGRLHTSSDSSFSKKRTSFQEFFRSKAPEEKLDFIQNRPIFSVFPTNTSPTTYNHLTNM